MAICRKKQILKTNQLPLTGIIPLVVSSFWTCNVVFCRENNKGLRITSVSEKNSFLFCFCVKIPKTTFPSWGKAHNIGSRKVLGYFIFKKKNQCRILLTAEPIWFSFTVKLLIGPGNVYWTILEEGSTTLPRKRKEKPT